MCFPTNFPIKRLANWPDNRIIGSISAPSEFSREKARVASCTGFVISQSLPIAFAFCQNTIKFRLNCEGGEIFCKEDSAKETKREREGRRRCPCELFTFPRPFLGTLLDMQE